MQPQTTFYPQQGAQQGTTAYHLQQGQQQLIQPSPGQTIIIQTANVAQPGRVENYPAKTSLIMGVLQLAIGVLLIIFNIVAICIDSELAGVGHGVWAGLWFILTGAFGVSAGKLKATCSVITFMVLSIIACLVAAVCLIITAIGVTCDAADDCYSDDDWDLTVSRKRARTSIGVTMAILFGVEGVVAIVSSALCCCGFCCGRTASTGGVVVTQGPPVQYVTTPGQPVAFTQGPQPATLPVPVAGVASTNAGQPMASAGLPMASAPPSYASAPPSYVGAPSAFLQL